MALTGSALRVELAECVRLGRLRRHAERVRAATQAASREIEPDALFGRDWKELDRDGQLPDEEGIQDDH